MQLETLQNAIIESLTGGDTEEALNLQESDKYEVESFESAGVLTNNKGILIYLNGKKVSISISE